MQNVPLSQDELKLAIGVLANVQLKAADGSIVFELVKKLDSFVKKPEPAKTPPTPDEPKKEATPKPVEPEVTN